MSAIVSATACCCGNPCSQPCCEPGVVEFDVIWSGMLKIVFAACQCDLTVPNFICPCFGETMIDGGLIGRGRVTQVGAGPMEPCGACIMELEAVPRQGVGYYNCICACQWEDPPGSGQFYTCQTAAPEFCGMFQPLSGIGFISTSGGSCGVEFVPSFELGADTSDHPVTGGRWYVVVPIRFFAMVRDDCIQDQVANYCHATASRVFTPNAPGIGGVLYLGPVVQYCDDGRVDMRSRSGSYSAQNVVIDQQSNQYVFWTPGTVTVT